MNSDVVRPPGQAARETVPAEDLTHIAAEFGFGAVKGIRYLPTGLMNRNWRVETASGVFALKMLLDVAPETARRSAIVARQLGAAGLPVCPPVPTRDGDPVLLVGNRAYVVSPWAEGAHIEGSALPVPEVREFGALVGQIHHALGDVLEPVQVRPATRVVGPDTALATAARLLDVIAGIGDAASEFDLLARHLLEERRILIDKHRAGQPTGGEVPGLFGWTHGDLQFRNILREAGGVTAVLDWDRVGVRPFGEEVARTAQVQFGGEVGWFDLDRVAAFVSGYRAVVPIPVDDLDDAVHRLWWKRLTDFWVFEFHYERGDAGPDHLMAPGEALLSWWTDRRDDVANAFAAQA